MEVTQALGQIVGMEFIIPEDPPDVAFAFEQLIAYQAAVAFRDLVRPAFRSRKPGTAEVRDQINRSSLSAITNTAEGAGRFAPADKAHRYLIACGSATESVSLLAECAREGLIDESTVRKARYAANGTISALTGLINSLQRQQK
jgi:four helix bundle protein